MFGKNLKVIVMVLIFLFSIKMTGLMDSDKEIEIQTISYDQFATEAEDDNLKEVVFYETNIEYTTKNGTVLSTRIPVVGDDEILNILLKNDVTVIDKPKKEKNILSKMIFNILPTLLFIGFIYFMITKEQKQQNSHNKVNTKKEIKEDNSEPVFFDDVAGCDEAKAEVQEVVDFLKNPEKYWALGAKIPHGVLLEGSPGNGKTLLAKAVSGEAGVPFFSISGSDFVEMYVGVGASRVRDLFEKAHAAAPCIIFIDEIDSIGKQRSSGRGGDEERERTLNALLVEMDGFGSENSIIVIAATNRADILDKALVRPGRFDRKVNVGLPDIRGREAILKVHSKNKKIDPQLDYHDIARGTSGFSGADLANLVNEAILFAVRGSKKITDRESFEEAKDKIIMGNARNGFIMKEKEKSLTAYHEAGHAIVGHVLKTKGLHNPVYKVSIIPRERSLGVTVYVPEEDKYSLSRAEAKAIIMTFLGGRIAEEMVTEDEDGVTTGASNDIERATSYATKMVTSWGFSKIGNGIRQLAKTDDHSPETLVSSKTQQLIDEEIDNILSECYKESEAILYEYGDVLETMHDALMVRETITQDDVKKLIEGNSLEVYENYEESFKVKDRTHNFENKKNKTELSDSSNLTLSKV